MRKIIAITLVFVTAVCLLAGCGPNPQKVSDEKIGAKIILVLEDGSEVPYDIQVSDGVSVREALFEAGLIDEAAQTAFFVEEIDGHVAKSEEGVLWNVCDENGDPLGMIDDVTIGSGKTIKIVYTVAPNFED